MLSPTTHVDHSLVYRSVYMCMYMCICLRCSNYACMSPLQFKRHLNMKLFFTLFWALVRTCVRCTYMYEFFLDSAYTNWSAVHVLARTDALLRKCAISQVQQKQRAEEVSSPLRFSSSLCWQTSYYVALQDQQCQGGRCRHQLLLLDATRCYSNIIMPQENESNFVWSNFLHSKISAKTGFN